MYGKLFLTNATRILFTDAHYVPPGNDPCRLCLCDNGHPKACKAVLCTPPHDCKSFQIGSSCCEFICLDDTLANSSDKSYDFGMWLVASGVTATLSLTLLFFLINRLRRRKTQLREVRQTIEEQRNMGSIGYIGGNIGYLGTGALNMDYPYEHGTAHYQLWKPPGNYFTRGEAPPPYEEAIALAQAESLNTCTVR